MDIHAPASRKAHWGFLFPQRQRPIIYPPLSYSYFSRWCKIGMWENSKKRRGNGGRKKTYRRPYLRQSLLRERSPWVCLHRIFFRLCRESWARIGISSRFKRVLRRVASPSRDMCVLSRKTERNAWKLPILADGR